MLAKCSSLANDFPRVALFPLDVKAFELEHLFNTSFRFPHQIFASQLSRVYTGFTSFAIAAETLHKSSVSIPQAYASVKPYEFFVRVSFL